MFEFFRRRDHKNVNNIKLKKKRKKRLNELKFSFLLATSLTKYIFGKLSLLFFIYRVSSFGFVYKIVIGQNKEEKKKIKINF